MEQQSLSSQDPEKTDVKIMAILDEFNEGVVALLKKVAKSPKVIMGYRSQEIHREIGNTRSAVNAWNRVIANYIKLFPGKHPSEGLLMELRTLSGSDAESKLKYKYILDRGIEIPNIKTQKILEVYDFPKDVEELIGWINDDLGVLSEMDLLRDNRRSREIMRYFRTDTCYFNFTDQQEKKIMDKYTVFATDQQLATILSLNLLCEGLSNLHQFGYTLANLPEIDHRLMRMIDIKRSEYRVILDVEVDIDRINNPIALRDTPKSHAHLQIDRNLRPKNNGIKIIR